jgi:16S rRNA (cytosine1402-N4)-methyltransferase
MLHEAIDALAVQPDRDYCDATCGGAGHSERILAGSAPGGRLLVLDRDPEALARAADRLRAYGDRAALVHGSFGELAVLAQEAGFARLAGVIFDLGVSSDQLEDPARGLSFLRRGPLDMRLDPTRGVTAAELVNGLSEDELADVIYRYGEEHRSRRIARAIVAARPLHSTTDLAAVIATVAGRAGARIHPATRTFQALRIAVNDELEALARAIPQAIDLLAPGGRLVTLTYHSLEDRIVKQRMRDGARDCVCPPGFPECRCNHRATLRLVARRPISPTPGEVAANPRARSARLRVAERLPEAGPGRAA